ncbi:MAG: hypothetical protein GC204_12475 [Chloroflexi bacterium]|nr:hypothetical protein [Chloroflexota bacterium]
MKARVIALLSFLLIFFALVPASFAQTGGQESPVGTPETPINGPALRLDTPVTVELSGTTPVNLSYKTAGSETVTITARSLETEGVLDPTLTVLNADGVSIASNDDQASSRTDLTPRDSLIDRLALPEAGRYTVQVAGSDDSVTGNVEVLVSSGSDSAGQTQSQTTKEDQAVNISISDTVPPNSPYTTTFDAREGEVVTITVKATDNQLDPKVSLLDSSGTEVASNDDHDSVDSSLGPYDSQIPDFTIPKTDTYTVSISGFAGIGGTFDLTVQPGGGAVLNTNPTPPPLNPTDTAPQDTQVIQGTVQPGDTYTYNLQANAGDVYTITVQSKTQDFDPSVSIYLNNSYVIDNDDYGSSDPALQSTDARIYNWIFQETGDYEIDVRGYQSSGGDFTMTLNRVATGAPYGSPIEQVDLGSLTSGETYSYNFDAEEGDWVTITVRTLTNGFDPYVSLLDGDGTVLLNNDDNGSGYGDYAYYDSLIRNYYISSSGSYTIEVTGVNGSSGSFGVTIDTERPG